MKKTQKRFSKLRVFDTFQETIFFEIRKKKNKIFFFVSKKAIVDKIKRMMKLFTFFFWKENFELIDCFHLCFVLICFLSLPFYSGTKKAKGPFSRKKKNKMKKEKSGKKRIKMEERKTRKSFLLFLLSNL